MPPPDRPHAGTRRIADVALRSPAPRRARVHWPAPCAEPAVAPLVVLFSSGVDLADDLVDDLADEVIARVGAVVLTVSATHTVEAHAAASWAADHAAELGADAARIALVGHGTGAALAERVAELAVDEGWPPLRHVALIWPQDDPAAALDGLARALAAPHPHRPTRSAR